MLFFQSLLFVVVSHAILLSCPDGNHNPHIEFLHLANLALRDKALT